MSSVLPQPPPAPSTPIHQVTLLTMCEVTFTYIPSASSLPPLYPAGTEKSYGRCQDVHVSKTQHKLHSPPASFLLSCCQLHLHCTQP